MGDWSVVQPPAPARPTSDWSVAPAPAAAPAPAPQVSGLESFGRGALQGASFGLSDEISGALESLFTSKSYTKARDESRANNAAAEAANPITYGAGNVAGGLATAVVPGLGAVEGATALGTAGRAAVQGAVAGLGTSNADLTKGDVAGALKDAGTGALTAGIAGGVLHKAGDIIGGQAAKSFENDANATLFGKARPKDALQAQRVQGANPEIFKEVIYGDDFKPVLDLARKGHTEEAVDAAQSFVDKASKNRLSNYEIASADGANGTSGSVVQRLRQEASARGASVGGKEEAKALSSMADSIEANRSVVHVADLGGAKAAPEGDGVAFLRQIAADSNVSAESRDAAKAELEKLGTAGAGESVLEKLRPELPKTGAVTKQDLWDAAIKVSGGKTAGDVPADIANAIEATKFSYDPQAAIPLLRLRQITTAAQKSAVESLGTIAETERARITGAVEEAVNGALESHLDAAAATSPKARAAVEAIRHDDKVISMGLSAKTGLTQKLIKENTGKGASLGDRVSQGVKGAAQIAGIGLLGHGNVPAGLALEAAPLALKAASATARQGNETLARLLNAEKLGNSYAKSVLNGIRQTPAGAARIAALMSGGPSGDSQ